MLKMNGHDLEKIGQAPEMGQYLIYTRKEVLFEAYASLDDIEKLVSEHDADKILELHLFDSEKEYRAVVTRSRRYPSGVIEHVAAFSEADEIYRDKAVLEQGGATLEVWNHIRYGANGMVSVDDYRLVMGGDGNGNEI